MNKTTEHTTASDRKKIIHFHVVLASFSRNDIHLLSQYHDVESFVFDGVKKWKVPYLFVKQFFFLLFRFKKPDLYISQFAGYHSFLPAIFGKLFGIPSLVILGGSDSVSFPSIQYGNFNRVVFGKFTKWSLMYSDHLSPVHESLVNGAYTYDDADYPRQGYQYFHPKIHTPYTVLRYGYDPEKFKPVGERQPNTFLTVGFLNKQNYYRKGIDLIVQVAPHFPECKFRIIGSANDEYARNLPPNVEILAKVAYDELPRYYSQATYYFQVSICEGFPSAICEAMLCGCIPIGSNVAAIPEIIGDTGFILNKRDVEAFRKLIETAMHSDTQSLSAKARSQIMQLCPKDERMKLVELVNQLMHVQAGAGEQHTKAPLHQKATT
ncbi:MAG: glycosyltransferase family 4 protein [Flavobacteriales bacterium]|nr:glycosyltransferase family 4 protein [Flavobacteriales bacterium]MCB9446986.1 glycosyltransferase family 4 protein [Flavobacteriales bacterium]